MAVESGAAPNQMVKSPKKKENEPQQGALPSAPQKRNNAPGIRLVGCRIYDSVNGKTCHQCRQKTRDFCAACKNQSKNKPCPINYCHKCLLNRYGEKAEEVDASGKWSCPKCRGICNCSVCMKRRGHQPTGILINTARKTGFSSVSEMLLKGSHLSSDNVVSVMTPLPMKEIASSPIKRGKENSYDGQGDANLPNDNGKVSENVKRKSECGAKEPGLCDTKKSKKMKRGKSDEKDKKNEADILQEKSANDDNIKEDEIITENAQVVSKQHALDVQPIILLPLGTELNTVAGIDVPAKDVGDALQFLQFCAAFGQMLQVKKGQPELVLQDLFHGRAGRPGKYSVTVQFHIHLLSILLTELGERCLELSPSAGENSWFDALKKCFSRTQSILKVQGLDCLEKTSVYESLEASEKLKLLNFLCDELLGTEKVRSWMDKQNTELAEKVKEAKQNVTAAKDKEKTLKQKMKDDVAKAIIARNGAPLSISEHEVIVSHTKKQADEAQAMVLELHGILLENIRVCDACDALRTEPLLGHGGNVYWKLNCLGNSIVLRQDIGKGDTLTLNEKWFAIDGEGKEAVDKHICSLRGKKQMRF